MGQAKLHLEAAQQRMKAAYDVHRRPVTFCTGDRCCGCSAEFYRARYRVLLSTRNINLKRPGG
eukprot:38313-Chlamydomonas_euryale.AAC.1